MRIPQLKQYIRAFATTNTRIPILVEGHMGIGKSQAVQQVAKELGYTYVDLRLAEQEPGDLIGVPRSKDGVTVWDRPGWIPGKDVKLMLALEEVNRAPVDVQQAIFQALTEYRIHTHDLPTETCIVACINPKDSIYHVSDLDPAFITRCFRVNLEPDVDDWLTWMTANDGDDRVIQFIALHRLDYLLKVTENGEPCPTPRTWTLLSTALKAVTDDKLLYELGCGLVGKEMSLVLRKFCDRDYKRPVTAKEVLETFNAKDGKVRGRLKEQRNDETYATVSDVCALLGSGKICITQKQLVNLKEFLLDLKAEWKVSIIQKLPSNMLTKLSQEPKLTEAVETILSETNKAVTSK